MAAARCGAGVGVDAGCGDVVHRAGLDLPDPQREPIGGEHRLDVAAAGAGLAGIPQVDGLVLGADGWPAGTGRQGYR